MPDDAIKDAKGRFLCYDYVHGRCNKGDACKRYHGPETPAMQKKRLIDEKKMKEAAESGRKGTQSEVEADDESAKKPPKTGPKAKAKTKAKAKGKAGG